MGGVCHPQHTHNFCSSSYMIRMTELDQMGMTFSMHGYYEKCIQTLVGKLRGRDNVKVKGARIILKCTLRKQEVKG